MSETPGIGTLSPRIRRQKPNRPEGEQSASRFRLTHGKTPEPRFGGGLSSFVANTISSIPVKKGIQDFYLFTAKEGDSAVLLPESSVITGRSIVAYKRGGWLELQERLPEEITVAAIWIYGVKSLRNLFEWGKKKFLPGYDHISTDTAWDKAWGKVAHVDLTPQEMFTANSKEINTLLRLKSVRWLFSVGLALTSVAYVIPKANQYKTDLILRHLNRRKRQTEGSNVQFGDPGTQPAIQRRTSLPSLAYPAAFPAFRTHQPMTSGFTAGSPALTASNPPQPFSMGNTPAPNTQNAFTTPHNRQAFQSATPYSNYRHPVSQRFKGENQANNLATPGRGIQFGGLGSAMGSVAQAIGHLVEQTPYGSILVVDAGIAGGRGYVASKRSLFETVEVLFRDVGSLYFYILCAPHLMRVLGAAMNKLSGGSIAIEPRIARLIHHEIQNDGKPGPLTPERVERVLKGATGTLGDTLMQPEGDLRKAMRNAPSRDFLDLLNKEAQIYLKGSEYTSRIEALVAPHIPGHGQPVDPGHIQKLLTAIANGHHDFDKLNAAERRDLGIAVKQAFRHTVGLRLDLDQIAEEKTIFQSFFAKLTGIPNEEVNELTLRIQRAAQIDNLNQAHSMLRRSLNVMHQTLGGSKSELFRRGDALASWIDEAVNRHMTLSELIAHELEQARSDPKKLDALKQKLNLDAEVSRLVELSGKDLEEGSRKAAQTVLGHIQTTMRQFTAKAGAAEGKLIQHYADVMKEMFQNRQGRLFSLAIEQHDAGLGSRLREMLKGGLENDQRFLHKALDIVGQLETDSRKFASPAKADKMHGLISDYAEALLKKANQPVLKATLSEELKRFYKLNRNLHYGAWTISMGVTMACLGWLVPHLQTLLTKRLTGKDTHPGIASAENAQEHSDEAKNTHSAKPFALPATPYFSAPSYNRNQYAAPYYHSRPVPYQGT